MNVASLCTPTVGPIQPLAPDIVLPASTSDRTDNAVAAVPASTFRRSVGRPLHHLRRVRRQEGLTLRTVAQRLGMPLSAVRQQEQPLSDLLLSDLYRWQQALAVPAAELLDECHGELSPPVQLRAQLVRVMKTVRSIQEAARQESVQRMAEGLADQLVELMPELRETAAWPSVGCRRLRDDVGQAFFRRFSLVQSEALEGG
jgi:transcriptional regulator with XRE-family HTH domain